MLRRLRPAQQHRRVVRAFILVRTNVDPGGQSAQVDAALHAASCQDVIESLPGGLTRIVGENGRTLSGGQRQRVALARAFAAAPPVLVLHDPTTAVDSVT